MAFQPGQIVGEYKVVRILGRGGLGAVYEATHSISERAEAMKVMLAEQTGTPEMKERFRREIQLLGSLNHPNIAGLHNAFYFEEQLVMMMELVEGEDLRTRRQRAPIPLLALMDYAAQVLGALEYAHARGVVHRDIKPANIMVSLAGKVKVLDFGIALTQGESNLTHAGSVIGSPLHMSPEQISGEKATPQSDIYSFGVTLYELIAGRPPFLGANTYEIIMAHINQAPAPLADLRPGTSPRLAEIVHRALEKQPARRFTTAAEFLEALQSVNQTEGLPIAKSSSQPKWPDAVADRAIKVDTGSLSPDVAQLARHLAAFIGPIAKVVVSQLAKRYTDLSQLYLEAAKQIDDERDRKKFLATRSGG